MDPQANDHRPPRTNGSAYIILTQRLQIIRIWLACGLFTSLWFESFVLCLVMQCMHHVLKIHSLYTSPFVKAHWIYACSRATAFFVIACRFHKRTIVYNYPTLISNGMPSLQRGIVEGALPLSPAPSKSPCERISPASSHPKPPAIIIISSSCKEEVTALLPSSDNS